MPLELETHNREAFELVTQALEFMDQYRDSRDVARLSEATVRLNAASQKDPNYFRARYYDAIVDDLSGRRESAVTKLTELLGQSPLLADEVRYNLGLAEYHGYSHSALERAIQQFTRVLETVTDASLRLRARAGLAQAYAMHMIPKEYDKPDLDQIKKYRDLALGAVSRVFHELHVSQLRRLVPFGGSSVDSSTAAEVRWTVHNAKGMALMYYSDYLPQIENDMADRGRERQGVTVKLALSELEKAERIKGSDWANRCDLGSATMRLGYFSREAGCYSQAISILQEVIDRLRPGYGFAIYETGRVLRLKGDYGKAIERFKAALDIPETQRDVSDRRVTAELKRAESKDGTFP
jgi:tetratricopeptide (TPR) repeat protein